MSRFTIGRCLAAISLAGLLIAQGCGTRQDTSVRELVSGVVGPAGGTVALVSGDVTLQVPLGALSQETLITLEVAEGVALSGSAATATVVKVSPPSLRANKPLLLKVKYTWDEVPAGDQTWLRLVRVGDKGTLFATVPAGHQAALSTIGGMIPGGGTYQLANLKTSGALVQTTKTQITDVDFLFVVDNSGSMEQEQKNLAANFPRLIKKLGKTMKSYRVGVISSDLGAGKLYVDNACVTGGDGGKLQSRAMVAGCTGPKDPWISVTPTGSNVPGGDVPGAFSCIANLGTDGCGFEQTLESAYTALLPGTNPGFLRKDAALAVVFISDEDDCSASSDTLYNPSQQGLNDPLGPLTSFRCFEFGVTCDINDRTKTGKRKGCVPAKAGGYLHPVDRYLKQLNQLKPAGQVVVSAIVGPSTPVEVGVQGSYPTLKPSCSSSAGFAAPSVRLSHLVKAFGKRGSLNSICDSDFSPALDALGDLVTTQTQLSWCLPYDPTDTDPLTPETIEGDCLVVGSKAGKIPACAEGVTGPCHRLVKSKACATSSTVIELENITPADLGPKVQATCLSL